MKRIFVCFLFVLVMCVVSCCAMANSWGLSGPLLNYVMGIRDFEDYTAIAAYYDSGCPTSAAVMHSKYHNILLVYGTDAGGNHAVWRSTTAIWQPDVTDAVPAVTCTDETVTLKTDTFGCFTFTWDENENTFILTGAEYGSFVLSLRDGVFLFPERTDLAGTAD